VTRTALIGCSGRVRRCLRLVRSICWPVHVDSRYRSWPTRASVGYGRTRRATQAILAQPQTAVQGMEQRRATRGGGTYLDGSPCRGDPYTAHPADQCADRTRMAKVAVSRDASSAPRCGAGDLQHRLVTSVTEGPVLCRAFPRSRAPAAIAATLASWIARTQQAPRPPPFAGPLK
jgi:hypothetical protein